MARRITLGMIALLAALLALPASARAGGWATVTLDTLPTDVQAGRPFEVGFMVRQHGQTPINQMGSDPIQPTVSATNAKTGQSVEFAATQQGAVGHFVASVTLPSSGAWDWEIIPAPFAGTQLVALVVAPATASAPAAAPAAAKPEVAPLVTPAPPAAQRSPAMWWVTGGLLLAGVGLTALVLRPGGRRNRPPAGAERA